VYIETQQRPGSHHNVKAPPSLATTSSKNYSNIHL